MDLQSDKIISSFGFKKPFSVVIPAEDEKVRKRKLSKETSAYGIKMDARKILELEWVF